LRAGWERRMARTMRRDSSSTAAKTPADGGKQRRSSPWKFENTFQADECMFLLPNSEAVQLRFRNFAEYTKTTIESNSTTRSRRRSVGVRRSWYLDVTTNWISVPGAAERGEGLEKNTVCVDRVSNSARGPWDTDCKIKCRTKDGGGESLGGFFERYSEGRTGSQPVGRKTPTAGGWEEFHESEEKGPATRTPPDRVAGPGRCS